MQKQILLLFLGCALFQAKAQTFSGSGGAIPPDGKPKSFTITPASIDVATLDAGFGVLSVCFTLNHAHSNDIEAALSAPDGTQVTLVSINSDIENNYSSLYFSGKTANAGTRQTEPNTGYFLPNDNLAAFNNGQTGSGTWKLSIRNLNTSAFNDSLLNWSITFGPHASAPFVLTSSDIPIVTINTNGQTIPDDPKITATMKVFNNGPGLRNYLTDPPEFSGPIGIEVRGSSSQSFPKKSYGFESWDALGNSIDTTFLGMPSESDWILNANYTDKSFLRNVMAYQVWQNMGHYATRYHFVEVILNGQYKGIYIFSEKIKRDKNRLDIAKLKPDQNTGDEVTGGYIFKIDKQTGSGGSGWISAYAPSANPNGQTIFFQYDFPDEVDITLPQKTYIQNNVYNFETALKQLNFADTAVGYRKYAVESTFIDYFLVNELSKNVDGYRLSTYLHKERDSKGGKIRMGPVWDYDIAWHNANYCAGDVTTGWAYQFPCPDDYWQVPFWWSRLLQDPLYKNHLKCRWIYLRQNILSNAWFDTYIDSISGQLMEAQERNFVTWPILGVYVWPNPYPFPTTYIGEVNALKTWMHNRLTWLDYYMPGTCETTFAVNYPEAQNSIDIYPNPVTDKLNVEYKTFNKALVEMAVVNQQGIILYSAKPLTRYPGEWLETLDVSRYAPGVYLVKLTIDGQPYSKRFIKT